MEKKTFWQRLQAMDNKMMQGLLMGTGIGIAMSVALDNWGTGIAIGIGIGIAFGASWSQQTKKEQ